MPKRFGFACINMTLSDVRPKSKRITTNRSMATPQN